MTAAATPRSSVPCLLCAAIGLSVIAWLAADRPDNACRSARNAKAKVERSMQVDPNYNPTLEELGAYYTALAYLARNCRRSPHE